MADQSDVEAALAGVVGGALYPVGIGAACAVPAAICRIYRGWPVSAALDADLAAGLVNVSVVAVAGQGLNTTRWPDLWTVPRVTAPRLFVNVVGGTATFSGDAGAGQLAALVAGGRATVHRTQAGDTPASVAAAPGRQMLASGAASVSGATVTLPGVVVLLARVEADQPVLRQTRRQSQAFRVTAWCPDPMTRDAIGGAIDSALSGIDFVGLADGTSGRLRFLTSSVSDRWEDAALYRRELTYSVDYPTTIAAVLPRMAVGEMQLAVNGIAVGPDIPS